MKINPDFLTKGIFADDPLNWITHANGFRHISLMLVDSHKRGEQKEHFISDENIFYDRFTYKIAVYLLAHSIELLLKAYVSEYNRINQQNNANSPRIKFEDHKVSKVVKKLIDAGILAKDIVTDDECGMLDEYLIWYGRYFSPLPHKISTTMETAYTAEDEQGAIEFKYKLEYPATYLKLESIFQKLKPNLPVGSLAMGYLIHCP